jgi:DNA-directed RNA polymerase subunit RPC12/RpoP
VTRRVSPEYNLGVCFPLIAAQWHPTRNRTQSPCGVMPGTNKEKHWWLCELGHEWQATVNNRTSHGVGCPYCSGKVASPEYNLAVCHPDIAAQWHPTRNGERTIFDVTPKDQKRRWWWVCSKGHQWEARVYDRTRDGTGCPYCSGRLASPEYNLMLANPEIASQLHQIRNAGLVALDLTPVSNKKLWWVCNRGHEWEARVSDRTRGYGCPYCSGRFASPANNLVVANPEVAAQFHQTRNGGLTPFALTPGSGKVVWWVCELGHEYQAAVHHRTTDGAGCPYCSGKFASPQHNLAVVFPPVAAEWHPTRNDNLTPYDVPPCSSKKVWWFCLSGHEYRASVHSRTGISQSGCPRCNKPWRKVFPSQHRSWKPPSQDDEFTTEELLNLARAFRPF